jgi:metacaspase-1
MSKKLALCIGINDYPGTDSDLSGCVNDANDWSAALTSRGFTVTKLIDGAATGKAMRESIAKIIGMGVGGDQIVIQYSGHGTFIPDNNGDESDGTDECLCPYDIVQNGPITDDQLSELFAASARDVKIIFISDSCNSGTVARFAPITTPPASKENAPPAMKVKFLPPKAFLSKVESDKLGLGSRRSASPPGRNQALLISGCQDTEFSYDASFEGRPNGAFTFVALRELAKLPASATYQNWFAAIRKALPSQQYPQSPNLYGRSTMKNWKVLS